ncbi:MAG: cytochrome c biogenesis protein CcdA [Thermodesulfobacteriota bacterium]
MEEWVNNSLEAYLKASVFMSFVVAFLGGVLASFTPCVYPMIPITAGFVGSRNVGGSRFTGFVLSSVYVVGIAVTYAALGMVAALTGRFFGEISSNPWVFFVVANIIILLGLGMLEVFEIPMMSPGEVNAGGFIGIFLMGIVSGFMAGPCTAPVLGVLLAYVTTTQDVFLGASLLFVFAFGMGLLLIAVGTFSGLVTALPSSGDWMIKIKKAMGLLMIALGEYFLIKMGQLML